MCRFHWLQHCCSSTLDGCLGESMLKWSCLLHHPRALVSLLTVRATIWGYHSCLASTLLLEAHHMEESVHRGGHSLNVELFQVWLSVRHRRRWGWLLTIG